MCDFIKLFLYLVFYHLRIIFNLIDIQQATAKTIEALNKLSLPAGVDIKIKATAR